MDETARFAQVRALFDQVCELPPDQREAQLLASGADPALIAKVRALLAREGGDTQRFAAPIAGLLGAMAGEEALQAGSRVGAWTLVRQIGAGGMGTVFEARRSDGHFEQTAAIKLLRGVPSPAALQFLARERQILAGLVHPNIARLLDGGATPQGQPFLVMDYLDGVPIDRYCRDQQLSLVAVLQLLIQICAAVAFAHARLVVHCDLKPSNILVDANRRPWLLDFGIARLLGNEAQDGRPSSTSLRARAFTPGFASPEQEAGGVVTTVSDVYSLGRLLQELASPAGLASHAELNAIAARATASEPGSRYRSALEFSQDIERYLAHQPVQALPPALAYRTRKWLQRNWPLAAAALVFALTVLSFTLQLQADRDRARDAERQALAERDRATQAQAASRQISDFLISMLDGANPDAGGGEIPTSKLVEQALQRIDTELAGQPAVQAELYGKLAGVQAMLGNPKLAQDSYEKAIELQRPLAQPLVLADLLGELALLQRRSFGLEQAQVPAREALTLLEQHAAAPADLAEATRLLGAIVSQLGDRVEGERLLRLALSRAEAISPSGPHAAAAMQELAEHLARGTDYDEAEALLRKALMMRAASGADSDALNVQEQLGSLLGKRRRFAEAEEMLRGALEQRRALKGEDDADIPWRLSELARILDNSGQPLRALPLYREALALAERKLGATSIAYAVLLNNLALASMRVGDYRESERSYRQAIAIVAKPWGERSEGLAKLRFNLATLLQMVRPKEALPLLISCESVYAQTYPGDHAEVIATRLLLAVVEATLGHGDAARGWLSKVDQASQDLGAQMGADRQYALALVLRLEGQAESALAALEQADKLRTEALGDSDPRVWLARIELAEWLALSAGSRKASAELAEQIMLKLDPVLVPDSPVRARLARLMPAR
jgi:serine/threonine-protein kinase